MKNILLIIIFICLQVSLFAQWQADVRLTYDPAQSYMSNPNKHCIASSGNVLHVVWHDQRSNWDIYYKRSTDAGVSWSADTRLTNGSGESHEASIAVSGSTLNIVFEDNRDGHWEIYGIRSTDGGINWGSDTRISSNDAFNSESPSLTVFGSLLHTVWRDVRDGNFEIYYKRSTDNGISWGVDARLTNNTAASMPPCIKATSSFVYVVWFDDRDGNYEIYYKRSTDAGITWGTDTRLSSLPYVSELTQVDATGSTVHVVWQDARDGSNLQIYYRRSTDAGTTWGTETRLTNNTGYAAAPNVTSSGLNTHVTWQDNRDGNFEVYYKRSIDGGLNWGAETRLTNAGGNSLRTFTATSGTSVNLVFMDERNGNWEIYYKQDPTGNPISQPPQAPGLVSPPNNSFNQLSTVRFIWNKSFGTLTYRLQVAQDSLFTNLVVNDSTLTDSTIVVTNLTLNRYYWWRVNAKNSIGTSPYSAVWKFGTFLVGLNQISAEIPKEFKLFNNYPNPFNPVTKIRFDIPLEGKVSFSVYDILGKEIYNLNESSLTPGTYEYLFDCSNFPSGIYFYRISTGNFTETKKMVLIK